MSAMLAETRPNEAIAVVEAPRPDRKRVVIIGGGFAGIAAAHALRHADTEVLLIDRRNHHIFQPLLYQVAMAILSSAEIAAPIRQLEAKQRNVRVLLAEITDVDVASRTIEAASPGAGVRKIAFDYLVVATGMRPNYFGHDEFARFAPVAVRQLSMHKVSNGRPWPAIKAFAGKIESEDSTMVGVPADATPTFQYERVSPMTIRWSARHGARSINPCTSVC